MPAEIFVSYARADRARAATLAEALEKHGWKVWWDRDIPPGRTFDDVIEEALANAKCVIVLWSHASVRSEWVKTEAAEAAKRRVLVPILGDEVRIPLEFRRIQAARLRDWETLHANEDWDQLRHAVAMLVGPSNGALNGPAKDGQYRDLEASGALHRRSVLRSRTRIGAAGALILTLLIALTFYLLHAPRSGPSESIHNSGSVTKTQPPPVAPPAPSGGEAETPGPAPATRKPIVVVRERAETPVRHLAAAHVPAHGVNTPIPSEEPAPPDRGPWKPATIPIGATSLTLPTVAPAPIDDHGAPTAKENLESSFEVTRAYGVFRDQVGQLSISATGVRYQDTGGTVTGAASFEVSCNELKKIGVANRIVDRDQRMLELGVGDRSYRFRAAHTSARDSILAALSRTCGLR